MRATARIGGAVAAVSIAVATAIAILAVAIVPFLNPIYVSFEQDRAEADLLTGWSQAEVHRVTAAVLSDLIVGPPNFAQVDEDGAAVFDERERAHLRDVRAAFAGLAIVVGTAFVVLALGSVLARRRGSHARRTFWRAARGGAALVCAAVVALAVVAVVAFDAAFELFHSLLFAGGSYNFDPGTEKLVQLFPDSFWQETSIALGIVLFVLGAMTIRLTDHQLHSIAAEAVNESPARASLESSPSSGGAQ